MFLNNDWFGCSLPLKYLYLHVTILHIYELVSWYTLFFFFETTHNKGDMTFFGKTAKLLTETEEIGHFEKILYKITAFLLALSLLMTGIIAGYLISQNVNFLEVLAICVVLLVASIPIAMNVVCTSTMALGSRKLSEGKNKKK